ncbi:protein MRG2-like isoform X5 [Malus domestica]|uniref:protein MRG2-like isoform X5 n=1 Tax=Malus domestica TaxID=3750 RepID=UPI0039759633
MKGRLNRGLVSEIWFQLEAISASIDEDFSQLAASIPFKSRNLDHWTENLAHWLLSWDEWVGLDRLMKNTDENKKKHEYLNQKQRTDKNAKLIHTTHTKLRSYHASRGKKRKNDSVCKMGFCNANFVRFITLI